MWRVGGAFCLTWLYQLGYTDVVGKLMAVAQEIVQRYTIARESTVVLAAAYGVTPRAIRLLLERNGVKCRSRSEAKVTLPHWTSAFATQTPERDYWCGFLFADGHIARERSSSPKLAVNLSVRDWEHLVRLRRYLCADHAIVRIRKQTGDGCILSVRCREIVDDLERLGMCMSPDRVAVALSSRGATASPAPAAACTSCARCDSPRSPLSPMS